TGENLPSLRSELRRDPRAPAARRYFSDFHRRAILALRDVEAGVEQRMLERRLTDVALTLRILDDVVLIEEAGDAQSLPDAAERQRANRRAKLECLLIVRFSAAVAFTVVEAAVNVAVVVRENPVTGETGVGRRQVSDALAEHGALETIAV